MTTVNALKLAITGGAGLARTNKFMVSLPSIGGSN